MQRVYRVPAGDRDFVPVADWNALPWQGVEPGEIAEYPWGDGEFRPRTQFKLLNVGKRLHVIFRVEDRFVRSVVQKTGGPVWRDSCVEFFFAPCGDASTGYFNVETNCSGTTLLSHQRARRVEVKFVDGRELCRLSVAHDMPGKVDPEVTAPVVWTVAYAVPYDIAARRSSFLNPAAGVQWRANFYKCAENNSHPHWGSWAPICTPKPDFHRPEFFGVLEFE